MEVLIPLLIYLAVPLIGLFISLKLFENIDDNTIYFISLINVAHFGGWLLILLTGLFWYWSGMAFLGGFYLVTFAPILSIGFFYWLIKNKRNLTRYKYALISSIIYIAFVFLLFILIFIDIAKTKK